ncbi:AMP-binding protein, partial [Salinigranum sp.]|uniref:AMP-binding protein n=1 Tax=Salinigranum sp. TaxID=1966351 RepID=UPI003566F364
MRVPDTDDVVHEPSEAFVESTNVYEFMQEFGIDDYDELVERTTTDVEGVDDSGVEWFWDTMPDYLGIDFYEEYDEVRDDADGPQFSRWYPGGELNLAHNVVDRHAAVDAETRNNVACIWEGEPGDVREITYHELARQSNKVANYLESKGIDTGDTVGLYMPMVPEVVSILYGCFKVGAIAVPIFSGFGVDATATRIDDSECSVLFTGDGFYRRGKPLTLKETADEAIEEAGYVEHTVVYDRLGDEVDLWMEDRDEWWADAVASQDDEYDTKSLPADQESILLYSSGTTGKPKGIVHTHAGVQMQCAKEIYFGFDHKPADRFF